jgi:hypothetical protein
MLSTAAYATPELSRMCYIAGYGSFFTQLPLRRDSFGSNNHNMRLYSSASLMLSPSTVPLLSPTHPEECTTCLITVSCSQQVVLVPGFMHRGPESASPRHLQHNLCCRSTVLLVQSIEHDVIVWW